MTVVLLLIASLICILLLFFLFRKYREAKEKSDVVEVIRRPTVPPKSPPPLPVRGNKALPSSRPARQVLDYPKCPIDRCRNESGKPQVIFWDDVKKCYTCCHGHRFTGRE